MSDKAMLVLGEAPESDDEEFQIDNDIKDSNNFTNSTKEVTESDQTESKVANNSHTHISGRKSRIIKESFAARIDNSYKMSEDTLLHKKLKEKNIQFYSNLTTFSKQMYINAMDQINETDQQLVKAQVLLQDTVTNWKYIEQNLLHIKTRMTDILSEEYIPKIRI